MGVETRFQKLLEWIDPSAAELGSYERHTESVRRRLGVYFGGTQSEVIGSYARQSCVRSMSDVDLMLKLARADARHGGGYVGSGTVLDRVRLALQETFPRTNIRRDGQAVAVQFAAGAFSVDVVPSVFERMIETPGGVARPVYLIPDGEGSWMPTSPQAHNHYIDAADQRSGGKLKYVARMIKYWRGTREQPIPLSSFFVELLLAKEQLCSVGKSYSTTLYDVFRTLRQREVRALRDPVGIAGDVPATSTESKLDSLYSAVEHAEDHAASACEAESSRDTPEAVRQWDIVFCGGFPKR